MQQSTQGQQKNVKNSVDPGHKYMKDYPLKLSDEDELELYSSDK